MYSSAFRAVQLLHSCSASVMHMLSGLFKLVRVYPYCPCRLNADHYMCLCPCSYIAFAAACSVFGRDVQDLLDMDRFNTPNSIQVSDSALKLFSDVRQFAPACKLICSGHEVVLHRWVCQVRPTLQHSLPGVGAK